MEETVVERADRLFEEFLSLLSDEELCVIVEDVEPLRKMAWDKLLSRNPNIGDLIKIYKSFDSYVSHRNIRLEIEALIRKMREKRVKRVNDLSNENLDKCLNSIIF